MSGRLRIQRAAPAHVQIERYLSQQIQSGALSAGKRLPSTVQLARNWGVHHTAVQKAMTHLAASGLVERTPRRGTFVKGAVSQAVVGILFGPSLADETAHFYRAILKAMRAEMKDFHWSCRAYDGLVELIERPDPGNVASVQHLKDDLRNYAFKGLVEFDVNPGPLGDLTTLAKLPRSVWRHADVNIDWYRMAWASVEFLAHQGKKKIVFMRTGNSEAEGSKDFDGFTDAIRQFGLQESRIVQLHVNQPGRELEAEAYQETRKLIAKSRERNERPDALLVSDDIAMRGVALALVQGRVRVPEKLLVVCGANEGVNLHYGIPVVRYEHSPRKIAKELLDVLWKRIVGQALPPLPVMVEGHLKVNG